MAGPQAHGKFLTVGDRRLSVRGVTYGTPPLVTAALTVTGMVTVTALIDWQLALVAMTVSPVPIVLLRLYGGRLRAPWHEAKAVESSACSVVHEVLLGVDGAPSPGDGPCGGNRAKQLRWCRAVRRARVKGRMRRAESASPSTGRMGARIAPESGARTWKI